MPRRGDSAARRIGASRSVPWLRGALQPAFRGAWRTDWSVGNIPVSVGFRRSLYGEFLKAALKSALSGAVKSGLIMREHMGSIATGMEKSPDARHLRVLTLAALGVVFGDIGTSPLYAVKECFGGVHGMPLTPANVLGILSLILWALIVIVGIKYVLYVLRADNEGEGGVFSLMALILREQRNGERARASNAVILLGLFGGALLYGDSVITPAISVLSAVEGLNVGGAGLDAYLAPITIVILCGLFALQAKGTGRIGTLFGPIMLLWFAVLGLLGLRGVVMHPTVLAAFNPLYAAEFLVINRHAGFLVLGAVFLAVTGGEALYADLGHFGRKPIVRAWLWCVLPGLLLNYLGQGAILLADPAAVEHPFFHLSPALVRPVLVLLATAATVIASQAVITGAFSLTFQAVQLDYLPRLRIKHTSPEEIGQIFVPLANRLMWVTTVALVIGFGSSSNLAAAYGIAVSTTMVITTLLMYYVARLIWHWPVVLAAALTAVLLAVDLLFFAANITKFVQGGWFPLLFGLLVLTLMTTWHRGRELLAQRLSEVLVPFQKFLKERAATPALRLPQTAVYMVRGLENTPLALFHNATRHRVVHERIFLVNVVTQRRPHVTAEHRVEIRDFAPGIWGITLCFGFNDSPDVPRALAELPQHGIPFDITDVTFYIGRETVLSTPRPGMARWRERLFAFLARNAQTATKYFGLPSESVVEIGLQIDI